MISKAARIRRSICRYYSNSEHGTFRLKPLQYRLDQAERYFVAKVTVEWDLDAIRRLIDCTGRDLRIHSFKRILVDCQVTTSPALEWGVTTTLFSDSYLRAGRGGGDRQVNYDVSADGRFVLVDGEDSAEREPPSIHFVANWYEEFRDREQD